jgi:hypothetical protein
LDLDELDSSLNCDELPEQLDLKVNFTASFDARFNIKAEKNRQKKVISRGLEMTEKGG